MKFNNLLIFLFASFLSWSLLAAPKVDGLVYLEQNSGSFCSGSLFAPQNYNKSQKALVLTNGHCTGMGSASYYGMNLLATTEQINFVAANNMSLYLLKKDMEDMRAHLISLNDSLNAQLIVATMYRKDIAIYEVEATYEELENLGYRPLILANKSPALATMVTYHSSAWNSQVTCRLEAYADMIIEGAWVWNNVMRMTGEGCVAQGGASGSPVVDESGMLVAALNTMYEGGKKCTIMNPCERERDSGTSLSIDGAVYAIPVTFLNSCFDQNKKLDLTLCDLQ